MGLKAASEHGATEHVESSSFDASASLRGASSGVESRTKTFWISHMQFLDDKIAPRATASAEPAGIWPLIFLTDSKLQHWNAWCFAYV